MTREGWPARQWKISEWLPLHPSAQSGPFPAQPLMLSCREVQFGAGQRDPPGYSPHTHLHLFLLCPGFSLPELDIFFPLPSPLLGLLFPLPPRGWGEDRGWEAHGGRGCGETLRWRPDIQKLA